MPLFFRILHSSYRRGAHWSQFVRSRVTVAGWMALAMLVLAAVLGGDVGRSRLYQLFALIFALVAVGMLWAWTRRARLAARRMLPRHATVGEECRYTVEVQNDGRFPARAFWLREVPPDPCPELKQFAATPEPGEENRNAFDRLFVYYRWRWLLERNLMFRGGRSTELLDLPAGEAKRVQLTLVPRRRGVIRFDDLRALLPDPFGLFQRCRWVLAPEDSLVVLPKRYRLPPLDLPGASQFQIGGEAVSNTIGLSGEFIGLRDYRPGDAMRHIHWKNWAKTGEPIVKEFEDTYFPRYGLVLDNFVDPGAGDLFEEAVSVAASFAVSIDTKRSLLDLMFVKDKAIV
ncbi:MAG: DUF58 domain-containing protein, partial [Akkermansiaceae bacterium]|nr:DUF58 domain-containing protein [Akkermansiaceae bacterium]